MTTEIELYGVFHKRALKEHHQRTHARDVQSTLAYPVLAAQPPRPLGLGSGPGAGPSVAKRKGPLATHPPPASLPTAAVAELTRTLLSSKMLLTCIAPGAFVCEMENGLLGGDRLYLTAIVGRRSRAAARADAGLREWVHGLPLGATVSAPVLPWDELHLRSGRPKFTVAVAQRIPFTLVNLVDTAKVHIERATVHPAFSEYTVPAMANEPALAAALRTLGMRVRLYHKKQGHHSNATEFAARGTLSSALNTRDTSLVFV